MIAAKIVVRPCDEANGSRTWDVYEVTLNERALARAEGRRSGVVIASGFRTRAAARAYALREVKP